MMIMAMMGMMAMVAMKTRRRSSMRIWVREDKFYYQVIAQYTAFKIQHEHDMTLTQR